MNDNTNNTLDLAYLKKIPLALEGLPASKLMDVVEQALSDAHDWITQNFPEARAKLEAFETLQIYYLQTNEKSTRDMNDVIKAICKAWGVTLFPVPKETTKSNTKKNHRPG